MLHEDYYHEIDMARTTKYSTYTPGALDITFPSEAPRYQQKKKKKKKKKWRCRLACYKAELKIYLYLLMQKSTTSSISSTTIPQRRYPTLTTFLHCGAQKDGNNDAVGHEGVLVSPDVPSTRGILKGQDKASSQVWKPLGMFPRLSGIEIRREKGGRKHDAQMERFEYSQQDGIGVESAIQGRGRFLSTSKRPKVVERGLRESCVEQRPLYGGCMGAEERRRR